MGHPNKDGRAFVMSPILGELLGVAIERRVIWIVLLSLAAFLYWSEKTSISEIASATGRVLPIGNIRKIEHSEGGLVAKIFVKNGDTVKAHDVLFTLDDSLIVTEIEQIKRQLWTTQSRLKLINKDLKYRRKLVLDGLQTKLELTGLQTQEVELQGLERELTGSIKGARMRRGQLTVRSPIAGIVNNLRIDGSQAVIKPKDTVMEIVPKTSKLVGEIDILPKDIGYIRENHPVMMKFVSFDYSQYGGIPGVISYISPTSYLGSDGHPFYRGLVTFNKSYIGNVKTENIIISGMTFQGEVATGSKTLMQYMLKPIFSSARSAFRER